MEVVVFQRCQNILPFKQLQVTLVNISKNIQVTYLYLCKTSYEIQKIGYESLKIEYGSSSQVKYTSTIDAIRTLKSTAPGKALFKFLAYYAIPTTFYCVLLYFDGPTPRSKHKNPTRKTQSPESTVKPDSLH